MTKRMLSIACFMRPPIFSEANDRGYEDAFSGRENSNPFSPGSTNYKQYEWGYEDGKSEDAPIIDETENIYA